MSGLPTAKTVAYFSMEIGMRADLPIYSGGLGVLAGDTLKSAADLGLPVVGVTLLYHQGYFKQQLSGGRQVESTVDWQPATLLKEQSQTVTVEVEGKPVKLKIWLYELKGVTGKTVPVLLLDSRCSENDEYHQTLSHQLYGGDERYRICQEIVLGRGGVKAIQALQADGCLGSLTQPVTTYHMNEGHAAFLTLELLSQRLGGKALAMAKEEDMLAIKPKCVFTTHTPVAAGHDRFNGDLVKRALGDDIADFLQQHKITDASGNLNMTHLALRCSRYINGVAKRHAEVSREMFPQTDVYAITNGIHAPTWVAPSMAKLFDRFLPHWREDNTYVRYACELPLSELKEAHRQSKRELISTVAKLTGKVWNEDIYTIGFARRAATYKRADLLFRDLNRLQTLASRYPGLQVVFSGKAHPKDEGGKNLIANVIAAAEKLGATKSNISVVYLPNYDMDLGRTITAGVDVWLNNPVKPMEASGTSGMKAAINGVPNLSTLDGWWVEGCVEGVTGWEIPDEEDAMKLKVEAGVMNDQTASALYECLENVVLPMYHENPQAYLQIRRHSIALNGSFFNTQRMVMQYDQLAWR